MPCCGICNRLLIMLNSHASALDYRLSVSGHDLYLWCTSLKTFVEIYHPEDVTSVIVIPIISGSSTFTDAGMKTDDDVSRRKSIFTASSNGTSASNVTSTVVSKSVFPQRPFQSPPLGRIDNFPRAKPIEIKKQYTQSKWWANENMTRSI